MATGLTVQQHKDGVVLLAGELSLAEAPAFESRLNELLSTSAPALVLDLTGVEFIDSTGLSVLVRAQQQATERGIDFGVQNPQAQAVRLLSLTGLADRLMVPGSPEATPQG